MTDETGVRGNSAKGSDWKKSAGARGSDSKGSDWTTAKKLTPPAPESGDEKPETDTE